MTLKKPKKRGRKKLTAEGPMLGQGKKRAVSRADRDRFPHERAVKVGPRKRVP